MSSTTSIVAILLAGILTENMVLSRFMGICPFLGVSKKVNTAFSMSIAVTLVMVIATAVTHPIYTYFLLPNELEYLQTVVFILVIAAIVQLIEIVLKKYIKPIYNALGIYLPLITTNCAVLGVAVLNMQKSYTLVQSVVNGVGAAVGFTIAMLLMAGIRERVEDNEVVAGFRGLPLVLIIAGFMALAFSGFQNLIPNI